MLGLVDADDSFGSGLRERLNQQEVALILVLRAEYDKALREGQVDEFGQVMRARSAQPEQSQPVGCYPEQQSERRNLLRRLRQLG